MDIAAVVQQLRTYAPAFNQAVGTAAQFDPNLESHADLPLPAAYVIPLDDTAQDNELQNALRQEVRERVAVIVVTDASADLIGGTAAKGVEATKYAVHAALLNWRIDPIRAQRGLQYAGGRLLHFDRARIFWQYEYELIVTIDTEDGFQPTATPLNEIDMQVTIGDATVTNAVVFFTATIAASLSGPSAAVSASA